MSAVKEMVLTKLEEKKTLIDGYKIKAGTTFDMGELYESLQRWFTLKGYAWKELRYKKVDMPDGSAATDIQWECTKDLDDYVSVIVDMSGQIMVGEVEVQLPNNAKKKTNKGSVELKFGCTLKKNMSVWDSKAFGQFLGLVYEKVLIRNRLKAYENAMISEMNTLFDEIRLYLGIR